MKGFLGLFLMAAGLIVGGTAFSLFLVSRIAAATPVATEPNVKVDPKLYTKPAPTTEPAGTGPVFTTTTTDHMVLTTWAPPTSITFTTDKGGIVISLKDGSVKIPEGMELDEASRQFWLSLAKALPYVRHQLLYGEEKRP